MNTPIPLTASAASTASATSSTASIPLTALSPSTTSAASTEQRWFLYLIRYQNNRLYTGVSTDPQRRLAQHQAGKGAKALRGKGELQLVFSVCVGNRARAQRLEYQVKQLAKSDKQRLINGTLSLA